MNFLLWLYFHAGAILHIGNSRIESVLHIFVLQIHIQTWRISFSSCVASLYIPSDYSICPTVGALLTVLIWFIHIPKLFPGIDQRGLYKTTGARGFFSSCYAWNEIKYEQSRASASNYFPTLIIGISYMVSFIVWCKLGKFPLYFLPLYSFILSSQKTTLVEVIRF